jgi:hypothetical protein
MLRKVVLAPSSVSKHKPVSHEQEAISKQTLRILLRNVDLSGKFLLVFASTVNLGSESSGAHIHIMLSHYRGIRANLFSPPSEK